MLNGLHKWYSKVNPVKPVNITHNVLLWTTLNLNIDDKTIIIIILKTIVKAVGKEEAITLYKKFPLILSLLGSSAKTNEGIPIVNTLVNVSWIGT